MVIFVEFFNLKLYVFDYIYTFYNFIPTGYIHNLKESYLKIQYNALIKFKNSIYTYNKLLIFTLIFVFHVLPLFPSRSLL